MGLTDKYHRLVDHGPFFFALLLMHALVIALGLLAALYMEHNGHYVTGMNNQIVWGMPHVFAVFLIVAASGALNVASISSVFNRLAYKRFARLSAILAISLLAGGLFVLLLDLGRVDRLIIAMTSYNFKSIFAWNIYLYTGFFVIVGIYLWTMMEKRMNRYSKIAGYSAFVWRLILTTGTGSIFGFLAAREAYDTALMAPLFIASSFVYGLAFTVLVLLTMCWTMGITLMDTEFVKKIRGLLIIFTITVLYFTVVMHLTNLYAAQHQGVEMYLLLTGGVIPLVFWGLQIGIGSILPMLILAHPKFGITRQGLSIASILLLIGGLGQMYVIIIGGQSYPLNIFPGMEASSTWIDGRFGDYVPSLPEIMLGVSGISITMLLTGMALKILPFLPNPVDSKSKAKTRSDTAEAA